MGHTDSAMDLGDLLKKPSAFLPIFTSSAALVVLGLYVSRYGGVRQADEGTEAHIWQLLMALQVPIVGWFAARWVHRAPRPGLTVLGIQVAAALAAFAPVFLLRF